MPKRAKGAARDDVADLAGALSAGVIPLARALRRSSDGMTPTQRSVLSEIDRHAPLSMGELSERQQLSPAMVSRVVTSLVDDELVVRAAADGDRRVCHVQLSDAGRRWVDDHQARGDGWLAERIADLTVRERQQLSNAVSILHRLVESPDD